MADGTVSLDPETFNKLVLLESRTSVPRRHLVELVLQLLCDALDHTPGSAALTFAKRHGLQGRHGGTPLEVERVSIDGALADRGRAWAKALQIPYRQLLTEAMDQQLSHLSHLQGFITRLGDTLTARFPGGIMSAVVALQERIREEERRTATVLKGMGVDE